jgi:CRISPR-associated Csx2 family protein
MHHLVSLIGKQDRRPGAGYRKVAYKPNDAEEPWPRCSLFGLALLRSLREGWDESPPVDRVVFLGTKGSSFDVLAEELELDAGLGREVHDAAYFNELTRPLLTRLADAAAAKLGGLKVDLRLVEDARERAGQLDPLRQLMDGIERDDRVSLDVTHGFRHLPMLVLASALLLGKVRRAKVRGLYYGALDPDEPGGPASVVRLDALVGLADWLGAFAILQHSGDFGPFADLLERDGVEAEMLEQAAHLERVTRIERAQKAAEAFLGAAAPGWPGLSGLFQAELRQRLEKVHAGSPYERQRHLAWLNLEHKDYTRAVLFGFEAALTKIWNLGVIDTDGKSRKQVGDEFIALGEGFDDDLQRGRDIPTGNRKIRDYASDFVHLKRFRNRLLHADEVSDKAIQLDIEKRKEMDTIVHDLFGKLIPKG